MSRTPQELADLALKIKPVAEEAGREILRIYQGTEWNVSQKIDESPLTIADIASNRIVLEGIAKHSGIPIISEEDDVQERAAAPNEFWLVDPLDGTRDFVAKLDTFVVCIALIRNELPVLGVIHEPVTGDTWWAVKAHGAFGPDGARIHNRQTRSPWIAAGSRSMPSERMSLFYDHFKISHVDRFGSALKFCKLAEGKFDLYPRFGPTHEWDTAAGQIIAEEAGCKLISVKTNQPMRYGKPGYLNGGFIASRSDMDVVSELYRLGLVRSP